MSEVPEPRERILKAATDRILHYGYGKTTMAEIAQDCGMSAGNIYRFFPGKIDIAEAMAAKFDEESQRVSLWIAADGRRDPVRKLRDFFAERLDRTFGLFDEHPKLMELARILGEERPAHVAVEQARERELLARILIEGADAGAFTLLHDPVITADLLQCATMKFRYPQLHSSDGRKELQFELDQLLGLLLDGLASRATSAQRPDI
jgi:AcrR family transcriptional regulator